MVQHYYNPVASHYCPGSLAQLPQLTKGANVVLVTFPEARELGLVDKVAQLLGTQLLAVIDNVSPNPDVAQLAGIYDDFWQSAQHCDMLVALGGGSAIDTAKALMVGSASGRFEELLAALASGAQFLPAKHKPLIAIPTTAGTGSEVTPWATIWDAARQKKYSLHLDCTWPQAAIIDPGLMLSLPRQITISSGLDALSHALESVWNINANPVSDALAVSAIGDILNCLPQLSNQLDNPSLRNTMALAALKAGLAFSNTKTALAHSISYEMTLRYGLPHGIACSFTLPMVLQLALGKSASRDRVLQQAFQVDGRLAVRHLREFLQQLEVATEFSDYGVGSGEALDMVQHAMQGARGKNFIGNQALSALP